jgi:Cu+-exporting ATPase
MNLFWAFGYNAAAIPLAAMACSSLLVVTNSLRLKRFQDASQASSPGSC